MEEASSAGLSAKRGPSVVGTRRGIAYSEYALVGVLYVVAVVRPRNAPSQRRKGVVQMKAKKETKPTSESGEIVKFDEAGMPQLDVWLEDETVWLTQAQMAELFGCAIANVNMHLNHIYADEELAPSATIKDFLMVRFEGKRRVTRSVKHYNLDAIISVGFRVNTKRGIKFRQWATKVLKEFLLRGLVRDKRIGKLEKRMTAAERSIDTIIYTLMPALPENREPIGFHA